MDEVPVVVGVLDWMDKRALPRAEQRENEEKAGEANGH